ncbi:MAG: histidine kinase dimerization/phospho-acceptor domain-containing protein [Chloroflexota bacterium]
MQNPAPLKHELAKAGLRWLPLAVVIALVIPLAIIQRARGLHPVRTITALNDADVITLLALAALAAVPAVLVQRKLLDHLRTEAVRAENNAVVRVCEAVAREFAQPLTGTLAYSELLLSDSQSPSESQRRALEGLCEGVARLDHLLHSVRDAVNDLSSASSGEHMVDTVVLAVNRRVPRSPLSSHDSERMSAELCRAPNQESRGRSS